MGVRGELFSTKVGLQNRTYFFNVKENRLGDLYLNIVESKNRDEGGFERQSVILFAEDLQDFLRGFDDALRVLEKAVRENKRQAKTSSRGEYAQSRDRDEGFDPPPRRPMRRERAEFKSPRFENRREGHEGRREETQREGRREASRGRYENRRETSRPRYEKKREGSNSRYENKREGPPRKRKVIVKKR